MRIQYISLEEAHPPDPRLFNNSIRLAIIHAYQKAIRMGKPVPPVPEEIRDKVLESKSRHSFF